MQEEKEEKKNRFLSHYFIPQEIKDGYQEEALYME